MQLFRSTRSLLILTFNHINKALKCFGFCNFEKTVLYMDRVSDSAQVWDENRDDVKDHQIHLQRFCPRHLQITSFNSSGKNKKCFQYLFAPGWRISSLCSDLCATSPPRKGLLYLFICVFVYLCICIWPKAQWWKAPSHWFCRRWSAPPSPSIPRCPSQSLEGNQFWSAPKLSLGTHLQKISPFIWISPNGGWGGIREIMRV